MRDSKSRSGACYRCNKDRRGLSVCNVIIHNAAAASRVVTAIDQYETARRAGAAAGPLLTLRVQYQSKMSRLARLERAVLQQGPPAQATAIPASRHAAPATAAMSANSSPTASPAANSQPTAASVPTLSTRSGSPPPRLPAALAAVQRTISTLRESMNDVHAQHAGYFADEDLNEIVTSNETALSDLERAGMVMEQQVKALEEYLGEEIEKTRGM